jgi:hypothetical protein
MPVTPADEVPFDDDDPVALVDAMIELTAAAKGWINLVPAVEEDTAPPPRTLSARIFSSRGEPVPMATWTAPEPPTGRAVIGIEHGSGPKALARLADAGLPLPPRWLKLTDHSRRGLVVSVPHGADPGEVAHWLLSASHVLTVPPLTGSWLARIYR